MDHNFQIIQSYCAENKIDIFRPRYISLNDRIKNDRDEFVYSIFPDLKSRIFSELETFILSRAKSEYNILLIGGNDIERMGKFIKINKLIINNIAKIALVDHLVSAHGRAKLLNFGFDDVFVFCKVNKDYFFVKIDAIVKKLSPIESIKFELDEQRILLKKYFLNNKLSPYEKKIGLLMVSNLNKPISTLELCKAVDPKDRFSFKRSIPVHISRIRKKGNAMLEIMNVNSKYLARNKNL